MDIKRTDFENSLWYSLSIQSVLAEIKTDPAVGLSSNVVEDRRLEFGVNQLTPKKGIPTWLRFLLQFQQPLIYILLAATVVTFLLKEWVDAFVIFGVVIVNAVIGFIQESKALKALDALSRSMTS